MSSFSHRHSFFLFRIRGTDKLKFSSGKDATDAFSVLALRLTSLELSLIDPLNPIQCTQLQFRSYLPFLS